MVLCTSLGNFFPKNTHIHSPLSMKKHFSNGPARPAFLYSATTTIAIGAIFAFISTATGTNLLSAVKQATSSSAASSQAAAQTAKSASLAAMQANTGTPKVSTSQTSNAAGESTKATVTSTSGNASSQTSKSPANERQNAAAASLATSTTSTTGKESRPGENRQASLTYPPRAPFTYGSNFLLPQNDNSQPDILEVSYINTDTTNPGIVIKVAGTTIASGRPIDTKLDGVRFADGNPTQPKVRGDYGRTFIDPISNRLVLEDTFSDIATETGDGYYPHMVRSDCDIDTRVRNAVTFHCFIENISTNKTITGLEMRLAGIVLPSAAGGKVGTDNVQVVANWPTFPASSSFPNLTEQQRKNIAVFWRNNDADVFKASRTPTNRSTQYATITGQALKMGYGNDREYLPFALAPGERKEVSASLVVGTHPKNERKYLAMDLVRAYVNDHPYVNRYEAEGAVAMWFIGRDGIFGNRDAILREADTVIANARKLGAKSVNVWDLWRGEPGMYGGCMSMNPVMRDIIPLMAQKLNAAGLRMDSTIVSSRWTGRVFMWEPEIDKIIKNLQDNVACAKQITGQSDMKFYWDSAPAIGMRYVNLMRIHNEVDADLFPENGTHSRVPESLLGVMSVMDSFKAGPRFMDPVWFIVYPKANHHLLAEQMGMASNEMLCMLAKDVAEKHLTINVNAWYNDPDLAAVIKVQAMAANLVAGRPCL